MRNSENVNGCSCTWQRLSESSGHAMPVFKSTCVDKRFVGSRLACKSTVDICRLRFVSNATICLVKTELDQFLPPCRLISNPQQLGISETLSNLLQVRPYPCETNIRSNASTSISRAHQRVAGRNWLLGKDLLAHQTTLVSMAEIFVGRWSTTQLPRRWFVAQ